MSCNMFKNSFIHDKISTLKNLKKFKKLKLKINLTLDQYTIHSSKSRLHARIHSVMPNFTTENRTFKTVKV